MLRLAIVQLEQQRTLLGDLFTIPGTQKRFNFPQRRFAVFVPLFRATEDQGAFAKAGKTDFLGAGATKFIQLAS